MASTWTLAATQKYSDGTGILAIANYTKLQAGTVGDIFAVTGATTMTLLGGSGNDTFNIGAALTGSLSGNAGTDDLNVAGNVTLNASKRPGSPERTPTSRARWLRRHRHAEQHGCRRDPDRPRQGEHLDARLRESYSIGGTSLTFTGYGNLQGGSGSDTFSVAKDTTANLEGGDGDDVFTIDVGKTSPAPLMARPVRIRSMLPPPQRPAWEAADWASKASSALH